MRLSDGGISDKAVVTDALHGGETAEGGAPVLMLLDSGHDVVDVFLANHLCIGEHVVENMHAILEFLPIGHGLFFAAKKSFSDHSVDKYFVRLHRLVAEHVVQYVEILLLLFTRDLLLRLNQNSVSFKATGYLHLSGSVKLICRKYP